MFERQRGLTDGYFGVLIFFENAFDGAGKFELLRVYA
jgi:hypothetical protein